MKRTKGLGLEVFVPFGKSIFSWFHFFNTDQTGDVVSERRYYPYGQERWPAGTSPTDFTFTAQRNEAGFGLMDYNARYYSPYLNRFISPDTIIPDPVESQSFNRYAYVNNNPLRYTDPSGHSGGDVIQGFIYEFTANNYDALLIPPGSPLRQAAENLAADQTGNVAFQVGRAIGAAVNVIQGVAEFNQGGTLTGGGLLAGTATVETGVGPVVGYGAAAVGFAEMVHGSAVAANGLAGLGESGGNILNAVAGGGGGKKGSNPFDELAEIGRPSRGKGVREVVGGEEEARTLFDKLTQGAEITRHPNPNIEGGLMAKLPDGGTIGFRPVSQSGEPTIDINIPDRSDLPRKIKFVIE